MIPNQLKTENLHTGPSPNHVSAVCVDTSFGAVKHNHVSEAGKELGLLSCYMEEISTLWSLLSSWVKYELGDL